MMRIRTALLAAFLALPGVAVAQLYDSYEIAIVALTNVAQPIKTVPGPVLYYTCSNPNTVTTFLQFYDTNAAITVGTTAATFVETLPANIAVTQPMSISTALPGPYNVKVGLQVAATTTSSGAVAPTTPVECAFGVK